MKGKLIMSDIIKDAILPIKYVNRQGEIVEIDPEKLLTFNEDKMPFGENSNVYFLIAELSERKRLEAKDLEGQLDALRGTLYIKYVQDESLKQINNGRKPPENMLKTAIESDAQYLELQKRANDADYQARTLNWLVKALDMKSNLMQTVSANKRKELDLKGGQL